MEIKYRGLVLVSVTIKRLEHLLSCALSCQMVQRTENRQELYQTRIIVCLVGWSFLFFTSFAEINKSTQRQGNKTVPLSPKYYFISFILHYNVACKTIVLPFGWYYTGGISVEFSTLLIFLFPWNRIQCQSHLCLKNKGQDDKQFML